MQRVVLAISLLLNVWLVGFLLLSYPAGPAGEAAKPATQAQATAPAPTPPPVSGIEANNLIWPSENFVPPNWGPLENAAIENDADMAPTGTKTAARLIEDEHDGRHRILGTVHGVQPGAISTLSVYVKPAGRSGLMLETLDHTAGKYGIARFDLERGRVLLKSGDVADAGVEPLANGWFRCWSAMPFDTDYAAFSFAMLGPPNFAPAYVGDGKSGILIWGAQLNGAKVPSPYVATKDGPSEPH